MAFDKAKILIEQAVVESSTPPIIQQVARAVHGDVQYSGGAWYVEKKGRPADTRTGMGYEYSISNVLKYDPVRGQLMVWPKYEDDVLPIFQHLDPQLKRRSTNSSWASEYRVL